MINYSKIKKVAVYLSIGLLFAFNVIQIGINQKNDKKNALLEQSNKLIGRQLLVGEAENALIGLNIPEINNHSPKYIQKRNDCIFKLVLMYDEKTCSSCIESVIAWWSNYAKLLQLPCEIMITNESTKKDNVKIYEIFNRIGKTDIIYFMLIDANRNVLLSYIKETKESNKESSFLKQIKTLSSLHGKTTK